MKSLRLLIGFVALALLATLTVGVASTAEAVTRPVPINGVISKSKAFIRGNVGADLAKKKISVERQARPGADWQKWKKVRVNKKGIYRIRVFRVPGSKATCYRINIRPINGFEKSRSRPTCIYPA
jgi:hypothetical protein